MRKFLTSSYALLADNIGVSIIPSIITDRSIVSIPIDRIHIARTDAIPPN